MPSNEFKSILLFNLLLLFTSTYSQSQETKKDFNKEGVGEQFTITKDGGSTISTERYSLY
jgi:hypothetical protein